jgi:hypothetical protein
LVVRETVADGVPTAAFCVCADASVAAKIRARDRFFTIVLSLGEKESFLIFSIVRYRGRNAMGR